MNLSATKIETILAERGITKVTLANEAGISRQNISTIIRRGTAEPKTVGKLAAALGVSVEELIQKED